MLRRVARSVCDVAVALDCMKNITCSITATQHQLHCGRSKQQQQAAQTPTSMCSHITFYRHIIEQVHVEIIQE